MHDYFFSNALHRRNAKKESYRYNYDQSTLLKICAKNVSQMSSIDHKKKWPLHFHWEQLHFSISNNIVWPQLKQSAFAPHDNDLSIVLSAQMTILSQPPPRWMRADERVRQLLHPNRNAFFRWPHSWLLRVKGPGRLLLKQVGPHFLSLVFDFDPHGRGKCARGNEEFLSLISSCWFYQVAMSECPQPWTTVPLL